MNGAISAPLPDGKAVALTVVRGPDAGAKFELTSARIVIGRKRGDVLLKDRETSSLHASIEYSPDGRFILKDLGSTNGTWLEGKRITVVEIRPGQHAKVGANHLLFSLVEAGSEATQQGRAAEAPSDVSLPSPWSGDEADPLAPGPATAPAPAMPASAPMLGPLDVDLGLPDLGPLPGILGEPFGGPFPPPAATPPHRPHEAPEWAAPPGLPRDPPEAPEAWPSAPPAAPQAWPAPPPPATAVPMPPPAPPRASAPVDPLSRTTPGASARTLPDKHRSDAAPPLPPLPAWPSSAAGERSTGVSPARPVTPPAAAPPAEPVERPLAPTAGEPAGLPAGVEKSVYGVYLVVERGRDRGRAFPINRQVTVLGRSGTEILINDPDISRRHAAIDVQGEGKYVLRDLNSTNGTLCNGVAVLSQAIAPNDKIRMGSTTIKLVVGDDRVAAELSRLAAEPGTQA